MVFNRPPRVQPVIQAQKVVIPKLPAISSEPTINWLAVILPVIVMGIVVAVMANMSQATNISYFLYLPLMLTSILISIVTYFSGKKKHKQETAQTVGEYEKLIKEKTREINQLISYQKNSFFKYDPNIDDCLKIAQDAAPRLGERRPADPDFLVFRLGLGDRPSLIEVAVSEEENPHKLLVGLQQKALELKQRSSSISDCPITVNLRKIGHFGISGQIQSLHSLARAACVHLAAHHWPSELHFMVFCDMIRSPDWEWIKQLPHRSEVFIEPLIEIAFSTPEIIPALLALEEEIRRRKAYLRHNTQIFSQSGRDQQPMLPCLVVLMDNVPRLYDFPAFSMLLKEGRDVGVHGIFLYDNPHDIPGECGAFIDLSNQDIKIHQSGAGNTSINLPLPDTASASEADKFARDLSRIQWLIPSQLTDPPENLGLLELFGVSDTSALNIQEWWSGANRDGFLRAPIGRKSPGADFILDLNEGKDTHGPHGIIGGATGSGKSEALKTIILSYCLTHNPQELNFCLIDYKGGSAFRGLEKLPHIVGFITDIEENVDYANRIILALSGELRKREKQFEKAREQTEKLIENIDDYHRQFGRSAMSRLIIIFDEFAEFKDRHKEESKQLISIVRKGRALGMHLILCTQNPSTIIDDQIKQNARFRICLNVSSAEDSRGFIGVVDAWDLPPGTAFFQIRDPQKIKVAYSATPYLAIPGLSDETIVRTDQQGKRRIIFPARVAAEVEKALPEAEMIVQKITDHFSVSGLSLPSRVVPDPLPDRLSLMDVIKRFNFPVSWNNKKWIEFKTPSREVVLGLYDDPVNQTQSLCVFDEQENKNLIVFGPSGSGKSSLLLNIAACIALTHSPDEAHIYCLDFGGHRTLSALKNMPHIAAEGGIIFSNDDERINRLFSTLRSIIQNRVEKFISMDVDSLEQFNRKIGAKNHLPKIYLLIDSINKQAYDPDSGFQDQLLEIIRSGYRTGIFTIITANQIMDIPTKISDEIADKIGLRLLTKQDIYGVIGSPPGYYLDRIEAGQLPPPGRGLRNIGRVLEFQSVVPIMENGSGFDLRFLNQMIQAMQKANLGKPPLPIKILEPFISARSAQFVLDLENRKNNDPWSLYCPIGFSQETLEPVGFSIADDGPAFMILSNSPGLGKTSILHNWIIQLMQNYSPQQIKFSLVDFHSRSMKQFIQLPHVLDHICTQEAFSDAIKGLEREIEVRKNAIEKLYSKDPLNFNEKEALKKYGYIVWIIDDLEKLLARAPTEGANLARLLIEGEDFGIRSIVAENTALVRYSEPILSRATKHGCGILLGGSDNLDTYFNNTHLLYNQRSTNLPPGRGYLVKQRTALMVQIAAYWEIGEDPAPSLEKSTSELKQKKPARKK